MSEDKPLPGPDVVHVDPHHIPTLYTDWIITSGAHDGVLNVTLGVVDFTLRTDANGPLIVSAVAKLRFSQEFAHRLHRMLGDMLGVAPPEGSPSAPPQIPKNQVN